MYSVMILLKLIHFSLSIFSAYRTHPGCAILEEHAHYQNGMGDCGCEKRDITVFVGRMYGLEITGFNYVI